MSGKQEFVSKRTLSYSFHKQLPPQKKKKKKKKKLHVTGRGVEGKNTKQQTHIN
jgi:hypothetical protein